MFGSNKFLNKDPLIEAVKQAQRDGDIRRQAEAYVNEEFGVYSRQAVVREHLAAYDAALEEAYNNLKEGNKENKEKKKEHEEKSGLEHVKKMGGFPGQSLKRTARSLTKEGNDGNLANNYPPYDKVTRGDVIAGRLGKDQMGGKKKMDEKKGCYEEGAGVSGEDPGMAVAKQAGAAQQAQTPSSTPKRTGNAAGSTISNARGAAGMYEEEQIDELKKPTAKTAMDAYHRAYDSDVRSGGEGKRTARLGRWKQKNLSDKSARNQKDTGKAAGMNEAIARKRDIAKGGVTAPIEYADKMGFANAGAISKLDEAWNRLKEARKCMEEESDTFDSTHLDEAYANYIAEAINEYGLQEEHPVVTVENLYMFNEAYIAAVLGEAAEHEKEKAEDHEEKAKELDEARMRAEKECNEEDDADDRKKHKVLAKTLKHIARKKAMEEELQIDEVSAFGQAFRAAGGKNFTFGGKSYSGTRADGKAASTPAASTPGTQGVATGKSFSAIDRAQSAKAKSGPADNPGLRGASPAMPKTPGTVARDTGITGKPGGETGVTSGSTVSLDRQGNAGASPSAPAAPAPKPTPAPTTATSGSTPAGAKPTTSSGLVGPDAGKMATPSAPAPTTSQPGAPKDDGSASVKKLMSMNESVQVGNNKYRIF